jgi:uncharacterized YccA/Bax inhibitor family protein
VTTSNPTLNGKVFQVGATPAYGSQSMTVNGTISKTFILLVCVLATAAWTWTQFLDTRDPGAVMPYLALGSIGGLIMALVTTFKKEWAPITAPIYALLEGLALGGFSAIMELRYPGIAMEAVALTFGTCACMLVAYRTGMIKVTQKFMLGVVAATGGIFVVYMVTMLLGFFHIQVPGIYGSGPIGIVFSLVVVGIAALNLVLDFSMIEQGARNGSPKYMEWYSAFGLMVTLVWLYIEILNLLNKLRDRR